MSSSSFSLPVNYYDKTTPYQFDDFEDNKEFDIGFEDFGEEVVDVDPSEFETESGNFQDLVQAFNPYVKVINDIR